MHNCDNISSVRVLEFSSLKFYDLLTYILIKDVLKEVLWSAPQWNLGWLLNIVTIIATTKNNI